MDGMDGKNRKPEGRNYCPLSNKKGRAGRAGE